MPDTTTTNYGWIIPEVGASDDTWGAKLKTLFETQDTDLDAVSDVADAALPAAGGTVSGSLTLDDDVLLGSGNDTITGSFTDTAGLVLDGEDTLLTLDRESASGDAEHLVLHRDDVEIGWLGTSDTGIKVEVASGQRMEFYEDSDLLLIVEDALFQAPPIYDDSTTNSANVNVISSGRVRRSTSTEKSKTDILPIDYSLAMTIVDNLNPVSFRSILPADDQQSRQFGFIAEDTINVMPEAGYMQDNLNYDHRAVLSVLTAAVKGLMLQVDQLRSEVDELRA